MQKSIVIMLCVLLFLCSFAICLSYINNTTSGSSEANKYFGIDNSNKPLSTTKIMFLDNCEEQVQDELISCCDIVEDYYYPEDSYFALYSKSNPMYSNRSLRFSKFNDFDFVEDTFPTSKEDEFAPVFYQFKHIFTLDQIFLLSLIDRFLNFESILRQYPERANNPWYDRNHIYYEYFAKIFYLKLRWSIEGEEKINSILNNAFINERYNKHIMYLEEIIHSFKNYTFKKFEYYGICHWRNYEITKNLSYEQEFLMDLSNFMRDGYGPIALIKPDFWEIYEDAKETILWFEFDYLLTNNMGEKLLMELIAKDFETIGCGYEGILYDIINGFWDNK
ncbi:MAG: hypothetical protein K8S87_06455 [Planctomycetes bacterium]|nr:hypothetical protein [Planctomycetota bacterium]